MVTEVVQKLLVVKFSYMILVRIFHVSNDLRR